MDAAHLIISERPVWEISPHSRDRCAASASKCCVSNSCRCKRPQSPLSGTWCRAQRRFAPRPYCQDVHAAAQSVLVYCCCSLRLVLMSALVAALPPKKISCHWPPPNLPRWEAGQGVFSGLTKPSVDYIVSEPSPVRTSGGKALLCCSEAFGLQSCQPAIVLSDSSSFLEGLDVRDT